MGCLSITFQGEEDPSGTVYLVRMGWSVLFRVKAVCRQKEKEKGRAK